MSSVNQIINFVDKINVSNNKADVVVFIKGKEKNYFLVPENKIPSDLALNIFTYIPNESGLREDYKKYLFKDDKVLIIKNLTRKIIESDLIPMSRRVEIFDNFDDVVCGLNFNIEKVIRQFNSRNIFNGVPMIYYRNIGQSIISKKGRDENLKSMLGFILQNIPTTKDLGLYIYNPFVMHVLFSNIDKATSFLQGNSSIEKLKVIFTSLVLFEGKLSGMIDFNMELLFGMEQFNLLNKILGDNKSDLNLLPVYSEFNLVKLKEKKEGVKCTTIGIQKNVSKDIEKIIGKLYKKLDWKNCYFSGSTLARLVRTYSTGGNIFEMLPNEDIDIFVMADSEYHCRKFINKLKIGDTAFSNGVCNIKYENRNFNFIRSHSRMFFQSVCDFHFGCARVIYNPDTGIRFTASAMISNMLSTNFVFSKKRCSDTEKIDNYLSYGYSFVLNNSELANFKSKNEVETFNIILK